MLHGQRSPKKKRKMNIIMILGKDQKRRPRGFLRTIWVGPFPKSLHIFRKLGPNSSLFKTGWIARKSPTTRGGHESPKYITSRDGLKSTKIYCFTDWAEKIMLLHHKDQAKKSTTFFIKALEPLSVEGILHSKGELGHWVTRPTSQPPT